ncbi:hypothetical protein ACFWHR_05780 [Leucobacter sp. NPDC058333]|uniref:hypothetical protein n=1 Tax=Leucobacter sp. NPDC058333 TaxID=3346450 RepID=UPI00365E7544
MTDKKSLFKLAGVLGAAALTLSLAACSGGQSVAEACDIAKKADTEITKSTSEITDSYSKLMEGDDVDFAAALDPASKALAKAQDQITNEDVKKPYDKLVSSFDDMKSTLASVDLSAFADISEMQNFDATAPGAEEKLAEMQKKSEELQAQASDLQTKMQANQTDLTDAVSDMNKVCSAG